MRFFSVITMIFLVICVNAHAGESRKFKIDENYTLMVDCSNNRIFHLVRDGETVFSVTESKIENNATEKCLNDVDFGKHYDGYREKVIAVLFEDFGAISPKIIYTINLKENRIELAGSIYKVDKNYSVIVDCKDKDVWRRFHLVHEGKVVSSIDAVDSMGRYSEQDYDVIDKYCVMVGFSNDFDGHGKNVLTISPGVGAPITSMIVVYVLDFANNVIKRAGEVPNMADLQKNGTFLHEFFAGFAKYKTIYAFSGDELVTKKSTALVYDGKVCVLDSGSYDVECENGIPATVKAPVCLMMEEKKPFKIIPLKQCDIKKAEISDIH